MTEQLVVGEEKNPSTEDIVSEPSSETRPDTTSSGELENREETRFTEGQRLRLVRVRFPGNSRSFPFLIGKRRIEYGQKVVAMSDRGMAVGYINSFPYDIEFNKSMLPLRSIAKVATQEDIDKDLAAYRQQKDAEIICNELIERYKLDMQLTHVEFTSFGKKAVFYFIAPARVDFRNLVKDLVGKLKTRIELRQISVRDRSASIGGIGPCGRELCCSSFLTKYGNTGIKMAKNQDLTLNFSKLNGVCGQLKCCLQYEDEVYQEKRSKLPREGDFIITHSGEIGRVDRLHLLSEQFVLLTNKGVRKRFVVDLYKETIDRNEANFPKEFDSISDETHKVIGLEESEAQKVKNFEAEVRSFKARSKSFAEDVFESLFGEKTLDYSLPDILEPQGTTAIVKNPEDEEEISYTPSDDDILPDDEHEDIIDHSPVRTKGQHQERGPREQLTKGEQTGERRDNKKSSRSHHHHHDRQSGSKVNKQTDRSRSQGKGHSGRNHSRNRTQR